MTESEAIQYLRKVVTKVRDVLQRQAPLVVRMIERQTFGVQRDKQREQLAYVQAGRAFGILESRMSSDIADGCNVLREGYNVDDPRLESFPEAARPYMVTASKAAAAECRDLAIQKSDSRQAQVDKIDDALATLGL